MDKRTMLLAAETFCYSYMNYFSHLGIDNVRFEKFMPQDVRILQEAEYEGWPISKLAKNLGCEEDAAAHIQRHYRRALSIVGAENPVEAFRHGIRFSIEDAIANGLTSTEAVENLVKQICYRVADLAFLLDLEGEPLSRYSRHLRCSSDAEYFEGYFDEGELGVSQVGVRRGDSHWAERWLIGPIGHCPVTVTFSPQV